MTAYEDVYHTLAETGREIDVTMHQAIRNTTRPDETLAMILMARANVAIASAILALADAVNRPADDVPFRLRPERDHPAQDL